MTAFIGFMLVILYNALFGPSLLVRIMLLVGWAIALILGYASLIDWEDDDDTESEGHGPVRHG